MKKTIFVILSFALLISCSTDGGNNEESPIVTIEDENGDETTVDVSGNRKSVGDSANDMLAQNSFDKLIVEIIAVEDFEPDSDTLDSFKTFLEGLLNKPEGIEIVQRTITSPGQAVYSIADIRAIENSVRTKYNEERNIAVSGIFLDGEYDKNTDNGSVLGVAYQNTSFVMFEETIRSFSGKPFGPSLETLETVVINHEFGHLLGLVNAGTPMQEDHQDVEHGRHCTNEDCLMFWTAETGEGLQNMLTGGSVPSLDANCLADLRANGGK
jgi:predicted Zn-dependent protease